MAKHHCSMSTQSRFEDKNRFLIIGHKCAVKIELFWAARLFSNKVDEESKAN